MSAARGRSPASVCDRPGVALPGRRLGRSARPARAPGSSTPAGEPRRALGAAGRRAAARGRPLAPARRRRRDHRAMPRRSSLANAGGAALLGAHRLADPPPARPARHVRAGGWLGAAPARARRGPWLRAAGRLPTPAGSARQHGADDDDAAVPRADDGSRTSIGSQRCSADVAAEPAALDGRVGLRWASDDRLPIVGAVPAAPRRRPGLRSAAAGRLDQPRFVAAGAGLFVFAALGSRGIAGAALGARDRGSARSPARRSPPRPTCSMRSIRRASLQPRFRRGDAAASAVAQGGSAAGRAHRRRLRR